MLPRDIDLKSHAKVHENLIKMLRLGLGEGTMQALTLAMSVLLHPVIILEFLYSYMFYLPRI